MILKIIENLRNRKFYEKDKSGLIKNKRDKFINNIEIVFKIFVPLSLFIFFFAFIIFLNTNSGEDVLLETQATYICFQTETLTENCIFFTEQKKIKIIKEDDINLLRLEIK